MFLELIAVIFAGIAVAGVMMLVSRATGGRLPRWLTPVAAGLAMIGVTISSEYGWYARTTAELPAGLVVAETVEKRSFYRPWTYIVPYTERFVALDRGQARSHPDQPGHYLVETYFFGRWSPVAKVTTLFDCGNWRRAVVVAPGSLTSGGDTSGLNWVSPASQDGLMIAQCRG